jgi:hypothetical protein
MPGIGWTMRSVWPDHSCRSPRSPVTRLEASSPTRTSSRFCCANLQVGRAHVAGQLEDREARRERPRRERVAGGPVRVARTRAPAPASAGSSAATPRARRSGSPAPSRQWSQSHRGRGRRTEDHEADPPGPARRRRDGASAWIAHSKLSKGMSLALEADLEGFAVVFPRASQVAVPARARPSAPALTETAQVALQLPRDRIAGAYDPRHPARGGCDPGERVPIAHG